MENKISESNIIKYKEFLKSEEKSKSTVEKYERDIKREAN